MKMSPETIVVGAGIVGLTVAERLARAGQSVSVIDARSDPFSRSSRHNLGTTYAGMDARHVSTTEHVSKARPLSAENFISSTERGGYLPKPIEQLTPREQYWVRKLAELTNDVEFINFVDFNICDANFVGLKGWRNWMEEDPELFMNVGLQNDVPIFYSDGRELETAIVFEAKWDEVRRLDYADIKDRFPTLAPHFESGLLIGGFETDSFAFGIHRFSRNLKTRLEDTGVIFEWSKPVVRIEEDDNGEILGLYTRDGRLLEAENFVFCPGIFGREVLERIRTPAVPDFLMGVAGFWVELPKLGGLGGAFKLSVAHLNVTPYEGGTRASGGFVFVGEGTNVVFSDPGVNAGLGNFQDVVGRIFPNHRQTRVQACIRPMTLTGWELWDEIPTNKGGSFIISAGQGAGGTTQAPYIADRVTESITGIHDGLHIILKRPSVYDIAPSFMRLLPDAEKLYPPEVLAELNRLLPNALSSESPFQSG